MKAHLVRILPPDRPSGDECIFFSDSDQSFNVKSNCVCRRYHGPNTGNMHTVADLYAEIIGVLAQSK